MPVEAEKPNILYQIKTQKNGFIKKNGLSLIKWIYDDNQNRFTKSDSFKINPVYSESGFGFSDISKVKMVCFGVVS